MGRRPDSPASEQCAQLHLFIYEYGLRKRNPRCWQRRFRRLSSAWSAPFCPSWACRSAAIRVGRAARAPTSWHSQSPLLQTIFCPILVQRVRVACTTDRPAALLGTPASDCPNCRRPAPCTSPSKVDTLNRSSSAAASSTGLWSACGEVRMARERYRLPLHNAVSIAATSSRALFTDACWRFRLAR